MIRSQIALGNFPYYLYPFNEFLNSVVAFEIRNIELWAAGPHLYLDDFTDEMLLQMHKEIKARGLKVICFTPEQCAYPINIGAEERYIRDRSLSYMKKAVKAAGLMECPYVLATPGNGYITREKSVTRERTIESLIDLQKSALEEGTSLLLEHLTRTTTNVAVTAKDLFTLWKEINEKEIGCVFDTDMAWREGECASDFIREASQQNTSISHVHFVDGLPGGHLALGDGTVPLEDNLKALEVEGYKGFLTFEVMHENYALNPDSAMKKCLDWIEAYENRKDIIN